MRAAETGRPVLQAAISGESAVIDPTGRLVQHTGLFTKAVVTGTIQTTTGETPYVRLGEWVLAVAALALLGAAAFLAWQALTGDDPDPTREPAGTGDLAGSASR